MIISVYTFILENWVLSSEFCHYSIWVCKIHICLISRCSVKVFLKPRDHNLLLKRNSPSSIYVLLVALWPWSKFEGWGKAIKPRRAISSFYYRPRGLLEIISLRQEAVLLSIDWNQSFQLTTKLKICQRSSLHSAHMIFYLLACFSKT